MSKGEPVYLLLPLLVACAPEDTVSEPSGLSQPLELLGVRWSEESGAGLGLDAGACATLEPYPGEGVAFYGDVSVAGEPVAEWEFDGWEEDGRVEVYRVEGLRWEVVLVGSGFEVDVYNEDGSYPLLLVECLPA